MRVDRVEVSWDAGKNKWLVRVQTGEEVVRRYCTLPKDADEQSLRSAVQKVVQDEGYESDPAHTTVHR
jgi:hypothetical protein